MAEMNLYQKIQAVADEVMTISKDIVVGNGSYAYKAVSDNSVVLAIKKAETKYRLVSIPVKQELLKTEIVNTQKGGSYYVDIVKMTTRIIDLDNPNSFIEIESFGRGLDTGDKGLGKASTYARKYALLNAYKIATGEDPDAEKSHETYIELPDEKRIIVNNYLMDNDNDDFREKTLNHFNLGSIDDLNKKQIEIIYSNLVKKGKL